MIAIGIKGAATSHFSSHGRSICIESFPDTEEPRPSVVLLHGANGTRFGNPIVSGVMQYLGVNGFIAHLVHYFDRTNTSYADDYTIRENFNAWLETVADGVAVIQERFPERPLGLFGHSLGGFLSAATLIQNPAVNAAVILSGGVDEDSALRVQRTAPVLIMHGTNDTRVPITEARRLEVVLTAAGAPPEVHWYRGEGHTLEMASYVDALDRGTKFLRRTLV